MAQKTPCDCGHESDDAKFCDECKRIMCPDCYDAHKTKVAVTDNGDEIAVQLFEAFGWFCVSCGHLNIVKMIRQEPSTVDLTPKEESLLREKLGLEPWEEIPSSDELGGTFVNVPYHVTCSHCHISFGTDLPPAMPGDVNLTDPDPESDNE